MTLLTSFPLDPARKPDDRRRKRLFFILELLVVLALAFGATASIVDLISFGVMGETNDDTMYAISARSLVEGQGYTDASTGVRVQAQRFPIGYPLLLAAAAWGMRHQPVEAFVARIQWVNPVAAGLFVVLVWAYLRYRHAWHPLLAVGSAAVMAFNDVMRGNGRIVASDVPFAALALLGVWLSEKGETDRRWNKAWIGIGALWGVTCLFRYSGAPFVAGVGLALLLRRRWAASAYAVLGLALPWAPWLYYRLTQGGEEYGLWIGGILHQSPELFWSNLRVVAGNTLTQLLPRLIYPAPLTLPWMLKFGIGAAATAVVVIGILRWFRKPGAAWSLPLVGAFTLLMTVWWSLGFVALGAELGLRIMLGAFPLYWVMAGDFLRTLWPASPRWGVAVAAAFLIGLTGVGLQGWWDFSRSKNWPGGVDSLAADTKRLLAKYPEVVPKDAILLSSKPGQVYLYTGLTCFPMPLTERDHTLLRMMLQEPRIRFIAALPTYFTDQTQPTRLRVYDSSIIVINSLTERYPGLLKPRLAAASGRMGLIEIERGKLPWAYGKAVERENARRKPLKLPLLPKAPPLPNVVK